MGDIGLFLRPAFWHLDDTELAGKSPDYLFDEIKERLLGGPVRFQVSAQLAEEGDVVDDATMHWPESRYCGAAWHS